MNATGWVTGARRPDLDAVVIGGGPAGLSAALYLGRVRRRVVLLDTGRGRNAPSLATHGVFTRDGTSPAALLDEARAQLSAYPTVERRATAAVAAAPIATGFVVRLQDDVELHARRLLLACGVRDALPSIEGLAARWGTTVLHCAYCHGFEVADEPLALHARGDEALEAAALLLRLSSDLLLSTDGPAELADDARERLAMHSVRIVETKIVQVNGGPQELRLHFADGTVDERRALFVIPRIELAGSLPAALGCKLVAPDRVVVGSDLQTTTRGVYAAGDLATPKRQITIAAASGAEAAIALHADLSREDFGGDGGRRFSNRLGTSFRWRAVG